jgi:hypothetical protein
MNPIVGINFELRINFFSVRPERRLSIEYERLAGVFVGGVLPATNRLVHDSFS